MTPPWYSLAFRELERDIGRLRRRIARGRARDGDREELEATELVLAELRADLSRLADAGGSPPRR